MLKQILNDRYLLMSHIAMVVMIIFSVVFAFERVLLVDSAYQLFYDINHYSILINDYRYSMFLSQLLPLLLIRLHAPLSLVVVAYSLSFMVIAYACFIIAAHTLRNIPAALLMVFTFVSMRSTFYHCISETFQLIFFAALLFALMQHTPHDTRTSHIVHHALLVLLTALAFFIHPIALFFIIFLIGYRMVSGERLSLDATGITVSISLAVCLAIKLIVGQSGHDTGFIPQHDELIFAITNFFTLNSIRFFYNHIWPFYFLPIILLIITLVFYARRQRWLAFTFLSLFMVMFFAMSVIVYFEGDGDIGMERTYLPLTFFAALPFFCEVVPTFSRRSNTMFFIIMAVMITISMVRIATKSRHFTQRLDEIETIATIARSQEQHKLLVTRTTAEQIFPINIWGLALESMILTACDGPDQTVTIYMEDDDFDPADPLYSNPATYVSVNWWKQWQVSELNPNYFHLPPQGYKLLTHNEEYVITPLLAQPADNEIDNQ